MTFDLQLRSARLGLDGTWLDDRKSFGGIDWKFEITCLWLG
ncbi:unnamed protein product [Anisakis simplex]|uniref:Transposase n=1 Tax=Anisakis simplex TaxID=6269 RepID=A0A0M3JKX9_ANISI|nr:unnamed protein product [Anisakis simplex]